MNIWDTAGQERFKGMNMAYLKGAAAAIIVYDICEKESLSEATWWLEQIQRQCDTSKVAVALVGNKSDREEDRKVKQEHLDEAIEGQSFPESNKIIAIELSAKTGDKLDFLSQALAARMQELGA
jgi:Ras-related protein Rab-5C